MKCSDCQFFKQFIGQDHGACEIELPPQLHGAGGNYSSMAFPFNGCSLGKAREEAKVSVPAEPVVSKKADKAKQEEVKE